MEIGDLIYNRRKELGLTLEQIGDYVGVSKSTVKKWESGYISNMKRDKIALLAKILQIAPTELISSEEDSQEVKPSSPAPRPPLTDREITVALAYRHHPEEQPAVDKLLGITEQGTKAPIRPNIISKDIAAFGGTETLTVDSDALDAAIERALKAKGLIK